MDLYGEIALVTGASRGIGRAIALQLAKSGAYVYGTATSSSGVEAINQALNSAGLQGQGIQLDVRDKDQLTAAVQTITGQQGGVTVLVNNAGITADAVLMRMRESQWEDVLAVNLSAAYYLSKLCLKTMIKNHKGRIINIASLAALTGNIGQTNYAAAKAGLIGFTKSLAKEVGSRAITVNAIAPGYIETDMLNFNTDEQRQALMRTIPLQRLGEAQEIAYAACFLASEFAAYITGETINVNGGLAMY